MQGFDGSHHKQAVINKILKALTGIFYKDWVRRFNESNEDKWDVGIPG